MKRRHYYIATAFTNAEMHSEVRDEITKRTRGECRLTYDWTRHDESNATVEMMQKIAVEEIRGVQAADFLVVLLPGRLGTHAEIGAALSAGKTVLIHDGTDERVTEWAPDKYSCIFYQHPNVRVFRNLEAMISLVADDCVPMPAKPIHPVELSGGWLSFPDGDGDLVALDAAGFRGAPAIVEDGDRVRLELGDHLHYCKLGTAMEILKALRRERAPKGPEPVAQQVTDADLRRIQESLAGATREGKPAPRTFPAEAIWNTVQELKDYRARWRESLTPEDIDGLREASGTPGLEDL